MLIKRFPEIETTRLRLREVTEHDSPQMYTYLSDPEVMKYYGMEPFESLEDIKDEIAWYARILKDETGIRWGISLKENNVMIGSCGFHNVSKQHSRAEIGAEIHRDYWGMGIASEVFHAVITYGFNTLGFERIQGLIEPANLASQRLSERHGFVREGLLRKYEYTCGKFDDLYMYSLLKEDFLKEK